MPSMDASSALSSSCVTGCVLLRGPPALPPAEVYRTRLASLRGVLAARPERCLLLIAHWGILNYLTGKDLQPGQMESVELNL